MSKRAALVVAIIGGAAMYLIAGFSLGFGDRLIMVFPTIGAIAITMIAIGHSEG